MVERVAVGRIVHGEGETPEAEKGRQRAIEPGERFNTDDLGLNEDDVKRMDEGGVTREPKDDGAPATPAGPGDQPPVTEDRSGPATGARSPDAVEQQPRHPPHGRRTTDTDL